MSAGCPVAYDEDGSGRSALVLPSYREALSRFFGPSERTSDPQISLERFRQFERVLAGDGTQSSPERVVGGDGVGSAQGGTTSAARSGGSRVNVEEGTGICQGATQHARRRQQAFPMSASQNIEEVLTNTQSVSGLGTMGASLEQQTPRGSGYATTGGFTRSGTPFAAVSQTQTSEI